MDKHLAVEVFLGTHVHLHRAVAASDSDSYYGCTMLPRLLRAQVPVDRRNRDDETALHVASRHGNLGGVCSLLNAGADVEAISSNGWTPLHLACRYGYVAIARLLLDSGACVDRAGFYGWTELHYAVQNGHRACIKLLAEYGATESSVSHNNRRPAAECMEQQWGIYTFLVNYN